jgi:precorrin-6A/cobalt-precorrin-6A reductase
MPVSERRHLLILGGTGEARALAGKAVAQLGERLRVTTSLAGRTRDFAWPAGELRRGGFGGAEGLAAYLREARIDLVVDATHPFAARISASALAACRSLSVPLLGLSRPPWARQAGDRWIEVPNADAAARAVMDLGRRAFLTIGRGELASFARAGEVHFLIRLVEPVEAPPPLRSFELIFGRGPFTEESERLIMTRHRIDVLVAKASGGAATGAKLAAARSLGTPVVLLRRPEQNADDSVACIEDALAWVERKLDALLET